MIATSKTTGLGFRDVRDVVLQRIRSGPWLPGTLIPAESALAIEFCVSRATVSRALQELSAKGYLERRRKGGTRVRSRPERAAKFSIPLIREEVEALGFAYAYRLIARKIETAPPEICKHLAVAKSTRLLHLTCIHGADAAPFQAEDRWINMATLPDVGKADFSDVGPNEWLVKRVPFTEVDMEISAATPPKPIALLLGQAATMPSLLIQRTTWLGDHSVTHVRLYFKSGYNLQTNY